MGNLEQRRKDDVSSTQPQEWPVDDDRDEPLELTTAGDAFVEVGMQTRLSTGGAAQGCWRWLRTLGLGNPL